MDHLSKPVVVAVKDKQPTAIRFAVGEARRLGTTLRVVHCVDVKDDLADLHGHRMFSGEMSREAQTVLDAARHFIEQELPVPPHVEYRLISDTPVAALQRESAAVMVVGSDQVTWPRRLLGAAVASRLVGAAEWPVVVVPELHHPRERRSGVVIAADAGGFMPWDALHFAFEEARHRSTHVIVLHAVSVERSREDAERARSRIANVLTRWRATHPGVRAMSTAVTQDAVVACIHASRHAELLVLGRPRQPETPHAWRRAIFDAVIREAASPVAIVPS
ncbi:universal stress protein [Aeromicrobium sp.]|uniref:universal stress protein n=1 Tax=Aeromicrobium sp. TaxID=1871063 RepID=UPI003D6B1055